MPKLSIVIPCYNESAGLNELYRRVVAVAESCVENDFELILVNDGSCDATWQHILVLTQQDHRVVGINLSRNFGHQAALSAGLENCCGERVFILDADLQDPPELLPDMWAKMDQGADIVYGLRSERQGETWFKLMSAKFFYRLLNKLTDISIPLDTGDFRLINRAVCDQFNALPERQRFIRGMIAWLGYQQEAVQYVRHQRFAGETKYPLGKMIAFAVDAITSFSISPIRLSVHFALYCFGFALLLACYVLFSWVEFKTLPGWASLAMMIALLGAGQFLVLAVLGEYVGRIYVEVKGRPLFVVKKIQKNSNVL